MLLRGITWMAWALVAGSAAFWGLKLFTAAPAMPAHTLVAAATPGAHGNLARLFGTDAPPPQAFVAPADARYHLLGVVSPRRPSASREGLALIVVDGKPARAFRVGAQVDETNVLQSVNARGATLGPSGGAAVVALTIPPPTPAATGTPPSALPTPGFPPRLQRRQPQAVQPPQVARPQADNADSSQDDPAEDPTQNGQDDEDPAPSFRDGPAPSAPGPNGQPSR